MRREMDAVEMAATIAPELNRMPMPATAIRRLAADIVYCASYG